VKRALFVGGRLWTHSGVGGFEGTERIEEPRRQQFVDNLAELKADYDVMRMTEALQAGARQDEAQSPNSAQIARIAPCPCGSGLKYKSCCGAASPGKFTKAAA
jgi:hypothetical protein